MKSFKQLREGLNEARDIGSEETPPAMMVLRRRGVRLFPDGQRIALYTNDRYGLMFSVPYGSSYLNTKPGSPLVAIRSEEAELNEYVNVMPNLGGAVADALHRKLRSKFGLDKDEYGRKRRKPKPPAPNSNTSTQNSNTSTQPNP